MQRPAVELVEAHIYLGPDRHIATCPSFPSGQTPSTTAWFPGAALDGLTEFTGDPLRKIHEEGLGAGNQQEAAVADAGLWPVPVDVEFVLLFAVLLDEFPTAARFLQSDLFDRKDLADDPFPQHRLVGMKLRRALPDQLGVEDLREPRAIAGADHLEQVVQGLHMLGGCADVVFPA